MKIKNYYIYIFLMIFFGILLYNLYFIKKNNFKNDTIIVGTNSPYPPYVYSKNGKLSGFDIDLIEEICKKINKKIEFKDIDFDALILDAQSGRIHIIIGGIEVVDKRSEKILFTTPYLNDSIVIITNNKNKITNITDLSNKEIVSVDGFNECESLPKQKDIILIKLPSISDAILALTNNKCFGYVCSLNSIKPFLKEQGYEKFNIFELNTNSKIAIGVSKEYKDLFPEIENALTEISKNGTLNKLKLKWEIA